MLLCYIYQNTLSSFIYSYSADKSLCLSSPSFAIRPGHSLNRSTVPSSLKDIYNEPIVPLMAQTERTPFGKPDYLGWQTIQSPMYASSYLGLLVYWATARESASVFMGTHELATSYVFSNSRQLSDNHFPFQQDSSRHTIRHTCQHVTRPRIYFGLLRCPLAGQWNP